VNRTPSGPWPGNGAYLIAIAALLLAVGALYLPGIGGGFVFDDYSNLVFNARLHVRTLRPEDWLAAALSSPAADLPRPLAMLSFAANHFFTGLDPRPMKLTNIVIHLLNTGLAAGAALSIFRVAHPSFSVGRLRFLSLSVAAWWALLPINVTAVLFIVQRMESLSQTFVFIGLWVYVSGRAREARGEASLAVPGMLAATVIGMLVKESASLLPLYCLMLEVMLFRFRSAGRWNRTLVGIYAVIVVVGACFAVGWLLPKALQPSAFAHRNFTLGQRLLTEPRVLIDYIRWTLAPSPVQLGLFHDDFPISTSWRAPISTAYSIAAVACIAGVAALFRRRRPILAITASWFLIAHLLTATFIPLELVFEHRNYFSSFALCLGLADLLGYVSLRASKPLAIGAAFSLACLYGSTTLIRTTEWSDPLRFAKLDAAKHPMSPRATYSVAQSYSILSRNDRRSPFYAQALDAFQAARQVPNAGILPAQGQLILQSKSRDQLAPELWNEVTDRLRHRPIGPQELNALGSMTNCSINRTCNFPVGKMLTVYAAAMSQGENPEVLNLFGNYVLNILGDRDLAIRVWLRAHQLKPAEPEYVIALAKLYAAAGDPIQSRFWLDHLDQMGAFGEYHDQARLLRTQLGLGPEPRSLR
jgi:tetratricopeptide (TPR) repeat protein